MTTFNAIICVLLFSALALSVVLCTSLWLTDVIERKIRERRGEK
jgi:hypothetical protein